MSILTLSRWLREEATAFLAQLPEIQIVRSGLWDPKRWLLATALLVLISMPAFGDNHLPASPLSKLSPELQQAITSGDKTVDVVVQFAGSGGNHFKHAGAAGAALKRSLKAINGGQFTIKTKFL